MNLLVCNITSWFGSVDAEHYYGKLYFIDNDIINIDNIEEYSLRYFKREELFKDITLEDAIKLDEKDNDNFYEGSWQRNLNEYSRKTSRFTTIEEVIKSAIEKIKELNLYDIPFIVLYEEKFYEKFCIKLFDGIKKNEND